MQGAESDALRHGGTRDHTYNISTLALVRAARGFTCLFWGIPLGLLFFSSQTAGITGALRLKLISNLRLPAYVFGVLLMYVGVIHLYRAGPLTTRWPRFVRQALFLLFLQMYFAPFFHWWDRSPYDTFLILNVLGLLASTIWVLYVVNQLASLAGLAAGDDTFYIEAKLCGWSVVLLMALPAAFILLYGLQAALRQQATLYSEFAQAFQQIPGWIYALFLLPFTLTMASMWKAKETCLHRLTKLHASAVVEAHEAPRHDMRDEHPEFAGPRAD